MGRGCCGEVETKIRKRNGLDPFMRGGELGLGKNLGFVSWKNMGVGIEGKERGVFREEENGKKRERAPRQRWLFLWHD